MEVAIRNINYSPGLCSELTARSNRLMQPRYSNIHILGLCVDIRAHPFSTTHINLRPSLIDAVFVGSFPESCQGGRSKA